MSERTGIEVMGERSTCMGERSTCMGEGRGGEGGEREKYIEEGREGNGGERHMVGGGGEEQVNEIKIR